MSKKQQRVFWPVLLTALVALGVLAFVAGRPPGVIGSKRNTPPPRVVPVAKSPALLSEQSPKQDVQGLVIALRPSGFVPPEIDVADGSYLFIVQNRCGIRDLTFRLDREAGERLHEVHDQKLQWKKGFDLHPGIYVLSIVDHPKWRCTIRVSSH